MPERLRVGIVGAGMIAQVEHIPNLLYLSPLYDLVGVADPSVVVRAAIRERHGVPGYATAAELMSQPLDAIIVAVPDPLHAQTVLDALAARLHVFCEKPLCFTEPEAAAIAAARDRAGRVVQVGYMKRFDPNYEAALTYLPEGGRGLRYISVEVSDPDSWPFVAHRPLTRSDDVPAALIADSRARQRAPDGGRKLWPGCEVNLVVALKMLCGAATSFCRSRAAIVGLLTVTRPIVVCVSLSRIRFPVSCATRLFKSSPVLRLNLASRARNLA